MSLLNALKFLIKLPIKTMVLINIVLTVALILGIIYMLYEANSFIQEKVVPLVEAISSLLQFSPAITLAQQKDKAAKEVTPSNLLGIQI